MRFSKLGWISRIRALTARVGDGSQDVTAVGQVQMPERALTREAVQAAVLHVRNAAQETLAPDGTVVVSYAGFESAEPHPWLPPLSPRALAHALAVRYLADNAGGVLGNEASLQVGLGTSSAVPMLGSTATIHRHMAQQAPAFALRME